MLKGIIIAVPHMELLKDNLRRDGLPWTEVPACTRESLSEALESLQAGEKEVLCLVERDAEEQAAEEMGLFCIGYLNPSRKEERLSGCRILIEGFEEIDRAFLENVHTRALGLPVRIAETPRLLIREMTPGDLDAVQDLYREEPELFGTAEFLGSRREEEEKLRAYIAYMYGLYQFGMWVVIEKESGALIGRAGFGIADYLEKKEVDLGYLIGKVYRRRGYGEEAARAVLAYAKQTLEFQQVSAYAEESNKKSRCLLEKLGFRETEAFVYRGQRVHRYILELV